MRDLTRLTILGPLRFLSPPGWLINIITSVMMPGVWRAVIAALARAFGQDDGQDDGGGHAHASGNATALAARLAADASGVYRRIRRSAKQPA